MLNVATVVTLLAALAVQCDKRARDHDEHEDRGTTTWCYYCNWTAPDEVFKCTDMSAQCIRCNDPLVACIGKACFRYVAPNGNHTRI